MKNFLKFFKYLKLYLKPLFSANLSMILFVVFNLLSVLIIMPFIDLLFNEPEPQAAATAVEFSIFNLKDFFIYKMNSFLFSFTKLELVYYLCILMVIIFALKNLFSYLQTFFMSIVEQGVTRDIRLALYTHFHRLSLGYFTEERKGILISRIINDVQIIRDSMIAVINSLFRDPTLIILFSIVLFIFNWKLTLFIYILLPVTGFILAKIGDSLKRSSIRSQEKIADITSILDETFGAMRIVKAFNMEKYEIKKFSEEENKYFSYLKKLVRRRALAAPITEFLGVVTIVIILFFIGTEIVTGRSYMSPGSFIVYLGIFFQIIPSLKLMGQVYNSIQEGIAASDRVSAVLNTEVKIFDSPDAVELTSFKDKIEFENVKFKYEKGEIVLKNINLTIKKGDVVAIVGPSGAGKSTLIDLISRFYDVDQGAIFIDGIDIRKIKLNSLRALMGVVTQETILFNDSIKNNIAYGLETIPEEEIINAAKAANAHNFIAALEEGYNTVIGDRGVKISGGERQRLSIARALLKNPPILILDEATSSLDTESEKMVQEAIDRLMMGRTSIVIAHRLSTVQKADKIVLLNKGEIVEEGKHEELLKTQGLYNKLYQMQFKA
jgi:ATP-binding cassette, subfamily B, bacterial MsbA